jgi:hypothetical protein
MISHDDERESQELGIDGLYPDNPERESRHQHITPGSRRSGLTVSMYGHNRFSRYLRFATFRRHRRQQRGQDPEHDQEEASLQDQHEGINAVPPQVIDSAGGLYHRA